MGHIRNSDSLGAMRKACLTSAIRNTLGAAGGVIGALSSSQWGALAERLTSAGFSRKQEYAADDFAFGFLLRNGYDPYAMATALDKLARLASAEQGAGKELLQLFSTHPDSAERARRMREKAGPRGPVRKAEALQRRSRRIRPELSGEEGRARGTLQERRLSGTCYEEVYDRHRFRL